MNSMTSDRFLTACWPSWQSTLSNVGLPSCGCDLLLKSTFFFFLVADTYIAKQEHTMGGQVERASNKKKKYTY